MLVLQLGSTVANDCKSFVFFFFTWEIMDEYMDQSKVLLLIAIVNWIKL